MSIHPEIPTPDLVPELVKAEHIVQDMQAVNEQLLLAGLREQQWAEQLRDQLAFTRAITGSLSEGVYALDRAGQLTLVNPAAEQMLGWTAADLVGTHADAIITMHSAEGIPVLWDIARLQQIVHADASYQHVDVVITRRDGSTFPATYSAAPISIADRVVGIAVSLHDMTDAHLLRDVQDAYVALLARGHALLEQQVQERTHELARANMQLQAEIAERTQTEQARQHLLQQLVTAQEEERRHLARELHDQMGQSVTALMLAIKMVRDRVANLPDLQQPVASLHTLGTQLGQDVRTLVVQLRPPALDDLGLLPTLTTYIEQWAAQALVAADLYTTGLDQVRLPQLMETTIFRVVQEALTNIMRHAQATNVSVIIHRRAHAVQLIVEDNGVGFDMQRERHRPYAERRLGLQGMEERIAQLAGMLTIESTPDSGTTLYISLPLSRAA